MLCPLTNLNLKVESDCANLVSKLCNSEVDRSQISSIISDIQRLGDLFQAVGFKKIKREDNRVAHELARYSRVERCNGVLIGSAPS